MAARKPATKSTGTAVMAWEEEMAQVAHSQAATEKPAGGYASISIKGGLLSVDGNAVPGNALNVVIVDAIHENQFYTSDYDPDTRATPVCYAFGNEEGEMTPFEASPEPQHDQCEGCPNNEWGSADKGKGKACKNVRRMLVVTEDALESPEALLDAEMRAIKIPVMSVKNWTNYVRNVLAEQVHRPSWGVVTTISVIPDAKSQFKVQFEFSELVNFDQTLYDAMQTKVRIAKESIAAAYPVFEEEAPPPKRNAKVQQVKPQGRAAAAMAKTAAKPRAGKY